MMNESEDTLDQIKGLAEAMVTLENQIEDKQGELDALQSRYKHITDQLLPDLFAMHDINNITTRSGKNIELMEFYVGSAGSDEAVNWLVENDFDSIIKNTITVSFGKGEASHANELAEELRSKGMGFNQKEAIHHSTLKSFINEQCKENPDFPRDLFKVVQIRRVKTK